MYGNDSQHPLSLSFEVVPDLPVVRVASWRKTFLVSKTEEAQTYSCPTSNHGLIWPSYPIKPNVTIYHTTLILWHNEKKYPILESRILRVIEQELSDPIHTWAVLAGTASIETSEALRINGKYALFTHAVAMQFKNCAVDKNVHAWKYGGLGAYPVIPITLNVWNLCRFLLTAWFGAALDLQYSKLASDNSSQSYFFLQFASYDDVIRMLSAGCPVKERTGHKISQNILWVQAEWPCHI